MRTINLLQWTTTQKLFLDTGIRHNRRGRAFICADYAKRIFNSIGDSRNKELNDSGMELIERKLKVYNKNPKKKGYIKIGIVSTSSYGNATFNFSGENKTIAVYDMLIEALIPMIGQTIWIKLV